MILSQRKITKMFSRFIHLFRFCGLQPLAKFSQPEEILKNEGKTGLREPRSGFWGRSKFFGFGIFGSAISSRKKVLGFLLLSEKSLV